MNEQLLQEGKKVRNELMSIIGQLEALQDMENVVNDINIAFISTKIGGHMIVNSIISKERADEVQRTAIKALTDEIKEYEDRLSVLINFKKAAVKDTVKEVTEPELEEVHEEVPVATDKAAMSVEEIKTMLHEGKSLQLIADYYKVDKKAIYKFLERNHTGVKALRP